MFQKCNSAPKVISRQFLRSEDLSFLVKASLFTRIISIFHGLFSIHKRLLFMLMCLIVSHALLILDFYKAESAAVEANIILPWLQTVLHIYLCWQSTKTLFPWCWYWKRFNMDSVWRAMHKLCESKKFNKSGCLSISVCD